VIVVEDTAFLDNIILEVEYLIKSCVECATADKPSLILHRENLINNLVESLDKDVAWVDSYNVTGELSVPGVQVEAGEFDQVLQTVKKVWKSLFSLAYTTILIF